MTFDGDKLAYILSVFADDPALTRSDVQRRHDYVITARRWTMGAERHDSIPHQYGEAPWAGSGPGEDSDGIVHGTYNKNCRPRCESCRGAAAAYRRELRAKASVA